MPSRPASTKAAGEPRRRLTSVPFRGHARYLNP